MKDDAWKEKLALHGRDRARHEAEVVRRNNDKILGRKPDVF